MATTKENKGTRAFNDTIREYFEGMAENDALFAVKFANPTKSMEDCVTYIINQVQKSGCNPMMKSSEWQSTIGKKARLRSATQSPAKWW